MKRSIRLITLCALSLAACQGTPATNSGPVIASALITATQGGTLTVTSEESVALAGTSLSVPPGALAADTTISIALGNPLPLPADATVAGPVAAFTPSGLPFKLPATMTLPYLLPTSASLDSLAIEAVEDDGSHAVLGNSSIDIDPTSETGAFYVNAFTRFGCISLAPTITQSDAGVATGDAAVPSDAGVTTCTSTAQCPPPWVCANSSCVPPATSQPDGGAVACTKDADCGANMVCSFLISDHCSAEPTCLPKMGNCDSVLSVCACNGTTLKITGCQSYAPLPVRAIGGCAPLPCGSVSDCPDGDTCTNSLCVYAGPPMQM